ncbi:MAG: ribonuclease, partial [Burkholderiaceae bacterium]
YYLEHFANYRTAYGSLGGLMMLMVWFWLMSLVLLISAEINKLAAMAENHKK